MDFILFVAHNFTVNAVQFIRTFTSIPDIRLGLLAQEPMHLLPQDLQSSLAAFRLLHNVYDAQELQAATQELWAKVAPVHRIIAAVEQLQLPIAQVRAQMGITGMDVETALNFRDKARMKALLREAGIPCARYRMVGHIKEAQAFVSAHGFPVVIKPPAGAGSQATFKANTPSELEQALLALQVSPTQQALLEEFVVGTEHSFDTFSLHGQPMFHSLTHYYPTPLEVMREPWIQWQVLLPREVDAPEYDDIRQYAFQTLQVLGMQTGLSHLEWFRRADGSIAISEVAARPPGAQFPTLISRACNFNALEAWARLMIFDTFQLPARQYAVGAAYLRGQGQGKVTAIHGLEQLEKEIGHLVTDAKIPAIGQPALPSYEGEGYIIIRHEETEVVRQALQRIVSTARIILS